MTILNSAPNYEQMYREVEGLVKNLQNPNLPLDDLIDQVQHGYELIRQMRQRLEDAKQRIETLQQIHTQDAEG